MKVNRSKLHRNVKYSNSITEQHKIARIKRYHMQKRMEQNEAHRHLRKNTINVALKECDTLKIIDTSEHFQYNTFE